MFRFKEYLAEDRAKYLVETMEMLDEARYVQFGSGGQVVFLAGGAGSALAARARSG